MSPTQKFLMTIAATILLALVAAHAAQGAEGGATARPYASDTPRT